MLQLYSAEEYFLEIGSRAELDMTATCRQTPGMLPGGEASAIRTPIPSRIAALASCTARTSSWVNATCGASRRSTNYGIILQRICG
jgi:hypothetical protein